jgi:peptidoglycan/xylan/chitin deacetylase (PgdA/CDA1 family)
MKIIKKKEFKVEEISNNLWLSNDHLQEIENNGHIIGLHSNSHPMKINDLDMLEQEEEYKKNVEHLRGILNQDIISMSHPCGNYDSNTLKILKDLGIKIGFRSNTSIEAIKSNLEIPREDHTNILKFIQQ